jgi:hypothetical protein
MLFYVLANTFSDGLVLCILLAALAGLLSKACFAWRDSFAFDPSAHNRSPSSSMMQGKQYARETVGTTNLVRSLACMQSMAESYLTKATECRRLAETASDYIIKRHLLELAEVYEAEARDLERRQSPLGLR